MRRVQRAAVSVGNSEYETVTGFQVAGTLPAAAAVEARPRRCALSRQRGFSSRAVRRRRCRPLAAACRSVEAAPIAAVPARPFNARPPAGLVGVAGRGPALNPGRNQRPRTPQTPGNPLTPASQPGRSGPDGPSHGFRMATCSVRASPGLAGTRIGATARQ